MVMPIAANNVNFRTLLATTRISGALLANSHKGSILRIILLQDVDWGKR
jgi:hypothetical protein